jgi:hypothetical protein
MTDNSVAWLLARQGFRHACKVYMDLKPWHEHKSIDQYERHLWQACLNFFRGDIDAFGFIDEFATNIENQLTRAWNEGAREVGVEPGDMTDDDLSELQAIIDSENDHVLDLATAIEDAINNNMPLADFRTSFRSRVGTWVLRYTDTVNSAKIYFGKKERLVWTLGATEEHCQSCAKLNGIVAYAEEWEQSGVKPQSPPNSAIECGGWKCDCSLETTDKRRTPNALTRIMDIAVSGSI